MIKEKISEKLIGDIINRHDPMKLLSLGAPLDEYSPEIRAIYFTVLQNDIPELLTRGKLEEVVNGVFRHYFSEQESESLAHKFNAIGEDLRKEISGLRE